MGMALGGGASLAGGLYGLFGGGNNAPTPQSVPIGGITSNLNTAIPGLNQYNLGGQNLGQFSNILQGVVNNPYAAGGINTAQQFAPTGVNAAAQGAGNAAQLGGAAGSILNQAFDPQNQLFQQQQDLLSQQTLAGLGQSGLANTPWGQGVYGNTMGNFDINWQNNELQRMLQGGQGALGLAQGAYGLGQQAPQGAVSSAMLPYNTYNTVGSNQLNALTGGSAYGQSASQIPQTGIGDWLQYLSGANSANQVANQSAQLGFNENQAFGSAIGSGLAGLGGSGFSPFGSSASFGGGNIFSGDAYGGNAFQPLPGLSAADYR